MHAAAETILIRTVLAKNDSLSFVHWGEHMKCSSYMYMYTYTHTLYLFLRIAIYDIL